MKKLLALLLVVCISAFIFVSCKGDDNPSETTGGGETTAGSDSTNASTPEVTTAAPETTHVFVDQNIIDSLDYDYIIRLIKDDDNKTVGVAVFTWKENKASDSITFDSEYVLDGVTYPVLQVGVGQGVLNFQKLLKSVTIPGSVRTNFKGRV